MESRLGFCDSFAAGDYKFRAQALEQWGETETSNRSSVVSIVLCYRSRMFDCIMTNSFTTGCTQKSIALCICRYASSMTV